MSALSLDALFEFLVREARAVRAEGQLERDGVGNPRWALTRDLTHLDADELDDRLQAWVRREVAVPGVSAFLDFTEARPSDPHSEGEQDYQELWHHLKPTLVLEAQNPPATAAQARAFLALIPRFLQVAGERGRPAGWRAPDVGNVE